jgi:exoribonuclease-2
MTRIAGLEDNLRQQDRIAQKLSKLRHAQGALDFQTIEARPVFDGDQLKDVQPEMKNHAKTLVEDFMIATNGVTARYLESKQMPSIRRVVRSPKRWNRIVEVAAEHGTTLPAEPDSVALENFLIAARAADPTRFPDLSLSIIKLLGPGEYVVEHPGKSVGGHFGLAARDYTHSTAPNRRYPDVITQRLLKAAMAGKPSPYADTDLDALALHCTQAEDAAKKVERQVEKSAMAMLLESRIGEQFEGIVTGASEKGTYIRSLNPPVEGRIIRGFETLNVGAKIKVRLLHVDAEKGFIDFEATRAA